MDKDKIYKLGLTSAEAENLLKTYGKNELTEKKHFILIKSFFSQFNNFLIYLLLAAGVISLLIGENLDSFFIFLIVFLNACFGVYQEFRAEKSLEKIKQMTVTKVRVIRDKKEIEIDSRYLVPGDLVYLEEGGKVPADGKIIHSHHFEVNEAVLTGESLPVQKNAHDENNNYLYLGTVVAKGYGYYIVEKTGDKTKFGQITKELQTIDKSQTPLEKKLEGFSKQIGIIGIIASIVVFILSFIKTKTTLESFLLAVSLAVAAVPEGLPAVMTIIMAIGVERLAKKKTIVRKLNAIETMGSITLVATDKTGTLTANKMRVRYVFVDNSLYDLKTNKPKITNHPLKLILLNSALNSTASLAFNPKQNDWDIIGDSTEGALLIMNEEFEYNYQVIRNKYQIIDQITFNPLSKIMTTVAKNNKDYVFTKGAPETILSICNQIQIGNKIEKFTNVHKTHILENLEKLAKKGYRLIAFSYKDYRRENLEKDQIFLGFVAIADPIRPEIKEAVEKAYQAGIKVVMITGDNELTAEAIAEEAGILKFGGDIVNGKEIKNYTDEQLLEILPKIKVFARTSPEDKYRLVKLYQKLGEITAVTGDGVNDVLALKQANVGVAMGKTGTDVTKETAEIILVDDNFATLINAIEEGRNIFIHIKNAIKYLLTCNISEVFYIIFALIFNFPILKPLQLLYINIVTDGLPAIALAFSPNDKKIITQPPRKKLNILDNIDFKYIFYVGILIVLLIIPLIYLNESLTLIFSVMIFIQQFILVDLFLSHRHIIPNLKLLFSKVFITAFLLPFVLHPVILFTPFLNKVFEVHKIPLTELLFLSLYSSLILVGIRGIKEFLKI